MGRGEKFIMVFLDTHIVVWLFQMSLELLSESQKKVINENDLFISPITALEIEYLFEIGRIKQDAQVIIDFLQSKIRLKIDNDNFHEIIRIALRENWTRDPFDRILVGHVKYRDAFLVTKDSRVVKNYFKTVF